VRLHARARAAGQQEHRHDRGAGGGARPSHRPPPLLSHGLNHRLSFGHSDGLPGTGIEGVSLVTAPGHGVAAVIAQRSGVAQRSGIAQR